MLDIVTDRVTECIEEHLTADEDKDAECDVTEWPAVFKGIHYQ
jgi:hypothetical protein